MKEFIGIQKEVADWKAAIIPPEHNTPRGEFDRSLEEVAELDKAITVYDGSRQSQLEVGGEAVDVIIRMLGIMTVVGCNAAEMLQEKIEQTKQKYPPEVVNGHMEQGLPWDQAMAKTKASWEGKWRQAYPGVYRRTTF